VKLLLYNEQPIQQQQQQQQQQQAVTPKLRSAGRPNISIRERKPGKQGWRCND
jgi:hypothetical protein